MISPSQKWILWSEVLSAWLVLVLLLFYAYLEFFEAPYLGFNYNSINGEIQSVFANLSTYDLQTGDRMVSVNGRVFSEWVDTLDVPLFVTEPPGDSLILEFQRQGEGESEEVHWPLPGFTWGEFSTRLNNSWWLGSIFWLAGLSTLLLVRPLDMKRSLFAAFFLLTALWLVVGSTTRWGLGNSRIVYRMVVWISVPVMLHLHWLFPRPLGRLPKLLLWIVYAATAVVALLQWWQLVPIGAHAFAYAFALVGSLCFLVIHYIRQPDVRANIRLLILALLAVILPLSVLAVAFAYRAVPPNASFALIALPLIPGVYFYSIYRYQLGGTEFRANRLIAVYLFLILLGTTLPLVAAFLGLLPAFAGGAVLLSTTLGLVIALATLYGFPPFQRLVERWLLAMPLPAVDLIDTYLARITTTLNQSSLVHLLKDEVLPTLLIRESALYRMQNNQPVAIYVAAVEPSPEVLADLMLKLKQQAVYRLPTTGFSNSGQLNTGHLNKNEKVSQSWVRLSLALQVEGKLIGIWLLGRHDPDDIYSPVDIATLQTMAHQSALALANIEQSTQLQALHNANIERQEVERMKLAHVLHDAVLNQVAVLYMSLDAPALSPRVESAYETLKDQIRQMISDLRPPSLDLGLPVALEELAAELDQRSQCACVAHLTVPNATVQYPPQIENHIFRIVQQACENAHRHAHGSLIVISGLLAPDHIELSIEDNGVGFEMNETFDLAYLLAHKHYGLAHMVERAKHINADLALDSAPGQGTRIRISWSANSQAEDGEHNG